MSLGLYLTARISKNVPSPETFLAEMQNWLASRYSQTEPRIRLDREAENPTLYCLVHPAAEEFELSLVEPSRLLVSANTTTAGPGYHMFVAALLKDLAREFSMAWEQPQDENGDFGDETGYFFSGDEARLRSEMKAWLAALARSFFDGTLDSDCSGIALCMPMNPRFETDQAALTALGPRDHAWLKRTAQNPDSGLDFWAWPDAGFTADYHLRRALAQMWTEVRWRPALNESEESTLHDVAVNLRQAYDLNPTIEFPWSEWAEILRLIDPHHQDLKIVAPRASGPPIIGYRRSNVTALLPGGWSIRIPGSFSEFRSDDDALCSLDPPREIWFTAYRNSASGPTIVQRLRKVLPTSGGALRIHRKDYSAEAVIRQKENSDGGAYFVLNSSNLGRGIRSVCTILFTDPAQKDWAIETWRSLRPASSEA